MTTCTVSTASSASFCSEGSGGIYFETELMLRQREQFKAINNAILLRRKLQEQKKQQQQQQNQLQQQQQQHPQAPASQVDQQKVHLSSPSRIMRTRKAMGHISQAPPVQPKQLSKKEQRESLSSFPPSSSHTCSGSTATTSISTPSLVSNEQPRSNTKVNSSPTFTDPAIEVTTKRGRRVHFFDDSESGAPVSQKFPGISALTSEEKSAVWWQPVDFKLMRRYCKRAAELARQSQYTDEFTAVYDACSGKHIHDMMEFCHISRSHVRGLEIVVFPALIQARKLVVRGVVKAQDKLPIEMSPDQKAKILSATSRCLSGRARLLARVYGVGDEEVAKDCYYSMGNKEAEEAAAAVTTNKE